MEQVKFFSTYKQHEVEDLINVWLIERGDNIQITRTQMSTAGSGSPLVTVLIFYKLVG